jgi:hypothetical protein
VGSERSASHPLRTSVPAAPLRPGHALREVQSSPFELGPGGAEGGHHLAGHEAGLVGELVDDREPLPDAFGGVGDGRNISAEKDNEHLAACAAVA